MLQSIDSAPSVAVSADLLQHEKLVFWVFFVTHNEVIN